MKLNFLSNFLRIVTLLLVTALLIGHGTPLKTGPNMQVAWTVVSTTQALEFDLNSQTSIRRFRIDVESENYTTNTVLWKEAFNIQSTPASQIQPVAVRLLDTTGNVRYSLNQIRYSAASGFTTGHIDAFINRPSYAGAANPIVVSCNGSRCSASSIFEVRLVNPATPVRVRLQYRAVLYGPLYEKKILSTKPKMPSGANITARITELQ